MTDKICSRCKGSGRLPDRRAKLGVDAVQEIRARQAKGERQKDLAQEFGVSEGSISRIVRGRTH